LTAGIRKPLPCSLCEAATKTTSSYLLLLYLTEFIIFATAVGHCERVDYQPIAATSFIDLVPYYFLIVQRSGSIVAALCFYS
jgi:hypothetical protein